MTVHEVIARRKIEEVVHFTTSKGLLGILATRVLKSRTRLSADELLEFIIQLNAPLVKDPQWVDYVNFSISTINTSFFQISAGHWHPELSWCILSLDSSIITHDGVFFVTTNNIYPAARRGLGGAALEALFAASVPGRYGTLSTRLPTSQLNRPTDIQAEVLYPGEVSTEFVKKIYVPTDEDQDNAYGQINAVSHPLIDVIVAPERFSDTR